MRRLILVGLAVSVASCGEGGARLPHLAPFQQALRPDNPSSSDLFRFDSGDTVEYFDSPGGSFRIHFARSGAHAVPATDSDSSGVPDFVEDAASIYDEVLTYYTEDLGFDAPLSDAGVSDNGGSDDFDVYLVDFAGMGDGAFRIDVCPGSGSDACAGYMVQENDYAGYGYPSTSIANRILASHEFFHAIEAAYDAEQNSVISEGSAVWATESFDGSLYDFEYFIDGYLESPDRSLDVPMPGPVDPFSYGSGIFFWFLGERYGQDAVRLLWERCRNGAGGISDPYWLDVLDPMLVEDFASSFAEAMLEFATWNVFTGSLADSSRGYVNGDDYPSVAMRSVTLPYTDDSLRVFYASSQYYVAQVEDREQVTAALIGEPEDLADLSLILTSRTLSGYRDVVVADPMGGTTIDTDSVTQVVVLVVSSALGGDSRKPGLCIGDAAELAACRASFDPPDTNVACEDQVIQELNLKSGVAPGQISNQQEGDGWKTTVDATAGGAFNPNPDSYVYGRFSESGLLKVEVDDLDALTSMDWDIAFRRFIVRINSGNSGPSFIGGDRYPDGTAYDTVTAVRDNANYRTDEYFTASCDVIPDGSGLGTPATALSGYWSYHGCAQMTYNVYILQIANGRHIKVMVTHFYNDSVQETCQSTGSTGGSMSTGSGTIQLRWEFLD